MVCPSGWGVRSYEWVVFCCLGGFVQEAFGGRLQECVELLCVGLRPGSYGVFVGAFGVAAIEELVG